MTKAATTIKQRAHDLVDDLPENATWDDLIEQARFRKAVEGGVAAADAGEFASEGEVRDAFSRWDSKA